MATGARSCLWSTAGLTITACQAPRRISCPKTSRQSHEQLRETRAVSITILFVLVPIGAIIAWWLSQQRLTAKPWLEVVVANYPFERSHGFAGIEANSGHRDYSPLSCGVG